MEHNKISKIIRVTGDLFDYAHLIRVQNDLTTILQKLGYVLNAETDDGFYVFYTEHSDKTFENSLLFFFDKDGTLLKWF